MKKKKGGGEELMRCRDTGCIPWCIPRPRFPDRHVLAPQVYEFVDRIRRNSPEYLFPDTFGYVLRRV